MKNLYTAILSKGNVSLFLCFQYSSSSFHKMLGPTFLFWQKFLIPANNNLYYHTPKCAVRTVAWELLAMTLSSIVSLVTHVETVPHARYISGYFTSAVSSSLTQQMFGVAHIPI